MREGHRVSYFTVSRMARDLKGWRITILIIFPPGLSYWMRAVVACADANGEGLAERGNIILMAGTGCALDMRLYTFMCPLSYRKPICQAQ